MKLLGPRIRPSHRRQHHPPETWSEIEDWKRSVALDMINVTGMLASALGRPALIEEIEHINRDLSRRTLNGRIMSAQDIDRVLADLASGNKIDVVGKVRSPHQAGVDDDPGKSSSLYSRAPA